MTDTEEIKQTEFPKEFTMRYALDRLMSAHKYLMANYQICTKRMYERPMLLSVKRKATLG